MKRRLSPPPPHGNSRAHQDDILVQNAARGPTHPKVFTHAGPFARIRIAAFIQPPDPPLDMGKAPYSLQQINAAKAFPLPLARKLGSNPPIRRDVLINQ